jgi:2-haloacid dehalogenase
VTQRPPGRDRWVLFDVDGTLLDYHASEAAAVAATLSDAGLAVNDEVVAVYRAANQRHWEALERGATTASQLRRDRWHETFAELGVRPEPDVELLATRYLRHLAQGTHLMEGAAEVLARVRRSYGVALITNGLADVERPRLAGSELTDLVDVIIISDEVGAAKPDPAIFDHAFAAMGEPAREATVLVGDSLTADIAGGAAYGIGTVWLAPPTVELPAGSVEPDHRIADLHELPPYLGV